MENINGLFSSQEHRLALSPAEDLSDLFSGNNDSTVIIEDSSITGEEIDSLFGIRSASLESANMTVCLPSALNESILSIIRPKTAAESEKQILQRILKFYSKHVRTVRGLNDLLEIVVKSTRGTITVPESAYLLKKMFDCDMKTSFSFMTPCCNEVVFDFKSKKEIVCPADGCGYTFCVRTIISKGNYSFR